MYCKTTTPPDHPLRFLLPTQPLTGIDMGEKYWNPHIRGVPERRLLKAGEMNIKEKTSKTAQISVSTFQLAWT